MARKKIQEVKQIDAKVDKPNYTTIEQVLGRKGTPVYKTDNEEEYKTQIEGMNLSDLQNHALSIGLLPKDDRKILIQRLLKAFNLHVSKYNVPATPERPKQPNKKVLDILSRGR